MEKKTVFSASRLYRYTLWRTWDMFQPAYLQVIGLNPSTADEMQNDPTIRRCIDFAKRWGYGSLCMTNLYAYRSTDPNMLLHIENPIGDENDKWLHDVSKNAGLVLAAWGTHKAIGLRHKTVMAFMETRPLVCLGMTKGGQPRHPLYVAKTQEPLPYG